MPKASNTTPASSSDGSSSAAVEDAIFEDFLADLSASFSSIRPKDIENELKRWLGRLAEQLGADRCTVGEFFEAEERPKIVWRWLVGRQPAPLTSSGDSWIQDRLIAGQHTSFSNVEEIPAEASATQEILKEIGVRSALWVPMQIEGSVIGTVGLTTIRQERAWPEQSIRRCRLVADVIGNSLERRRKTAEVAERTGFEALITDISSRFMNVGNDVDALVVSVVHELGKFLAVDRVIYLEVDPERNVLMPTRQWTAPGNKDDQSVQHVNVSKRFPWLAEKIMRNEPVVINDLEQFPDEAKNEKQYCESLGIQSFTIVPAELGGRVIAAIALDNIGSVRHWDDRIVQRLCVLASIIASTQHREQTRRELDRGHRFERAISKVSTAFVNLPPEEVDDQIENGLSVVAKALDADLITLLQPEGDTGFIVTHEWISEVMSNLNIAFKGSHVENDFPWLADRLPANEVTAISELSEFPAQAQNERKAMQSVGLTSVIWVPFSVRGKLAGYLAIDTVKSTAWPKELRVQLRLLGEVFGEALSRRNAELQLRKSFEEIEVLKEKLEQENVYLRQEANIEFSHDNIVGDSAALRAVLEQVEQVAPTDSTVLVMGETGTGKELLARAVHDSSARKDKLMVKVNCAALPASLVESELFGREKGAYTGALSREIGRFEMADGSTILLDEIGELPLDLQAKLLRVLQDGEFERLGSSKTLKVDVRLIAATNRDLSKAVEDKEFREDLFYRLNVFPIEVPPLRERADDIPQLVWAFVKEFSQVMGKNIETISHASMEMLKAYSWPGNVREARNIIERAMIISKGPMLEIVLPKDNVLAARSSQKLAEVEREHIRAVVESTGWRVRGAGGAAEILGLKPTTLEARMKKLGLERSKTK